MDTIRITDTGAAAGAFETAEYFMAHKRATCVRVSNRWTDQGQPAHEWHYKGPRKDVQAVYATMKLVFPNND